MFYRISKYNPDDYDENGKYRYLQEWTSYSDINNKHCFPVLTRKEYERVEENYLRTIEEIAELSRTDLFEIRRLERWTVYSCRWKENRKYPVKRMKDFFRDCLRNKVWGAAVGRQLVIDVGYDFYIHVLCDLPAETVNSICANNQLYCTETEFCEMYDVLHRWEDEELLVPVEWFGARLQRFITKRLFKK